VRAAADEIGGPVVGATFCDSDFAIAWFAAPKARVTQFFLNPATAARYRQNVDWGVQRSAARLIARAVGRDSDKREIRASLEVDMVFAEDSFVRLAGALGGFPAAELGDYVFGSLDPR